MAITSHHRSLLLVAALGTLHAGCDKKADPPWAPSALEGLSITQIAVHNHGYTSSDFYDHGLALLADGSVQPFDAVEGVVSPESRPTESGPVRALVSGDCAVFADDTARCVAEGAWSVVASGVVDYVPPVYLVSTGDTVECALTAAGDVRCRTAFDAAPVTDSPALSAGGHTFVSVSAGGAAICAVTDAAGLRCWENLSDSGADVPLDGVLEVGVSSFHACALLDDGTARCWGDNGQGALGSGGSGSDEGLETVVDLTEAVEIGVGQGHTCARRSNGEVLCWGDTRFLADLEPSERARPQPVPDADGAVDLSASEFIDCAAIETGGATCWGTGDYEPVSGPSGGFFIPGR